MDFLLTVTRTRLSEYFHKIRLEISEETTQEIYVNEDYFKWWRYMLYREPLSSHIAK